MHGAQTLILKVAALCLAWLSRLGPAHELPPTHELAPGSHGRATVGVGAAVVERQASGRQAGTGEGGEGGGGEGGGGGYGIPVCMCVCMYIHTYIQDYVLNDALHVAPTNSSQLTNCIYRITC
jgi:hypothetical protein